MGMIMHKCCHIGTQVHTHRFSLKASPKKTEWKWGFDTEVFVIQCYWTWAVVRWVGWCESNAPASILVLALCLCPPACLHVHHCPLVAEHSPFSDRICCRSSADDWYSPIPTVILAILKWHAKDSWRNAERKKGDTATHNLLNEKIPPVFSPLQYGVLAEASPLLDVVFLLFPLSGTLSPSMN